MEWTEAAEVAQAFLDANQPGTWVLRDANAVVTDGSVFVFTRVPVQRDGRELVVDRVTGEARMTTMPVVED